ncbi:hypothetical protein SAMN05444280_11015 [Tangfeifania diversioriginum]|uniref:Uncharacterized protein n=1 Tax=Tangfeifania diversioriginum TaxID=1168035 RepID=A0A1M6G3F2_9BACT|nr:hypothetical protein [Tangfeifania diversioriginum]SHJ04493.1 hypothetical protein SAMN05444280_11015 [Tangfeifania diversioriginum]
MATVIIDTQTDEAKKMLEFLKTARYARVVEEKIPNEETLAAINEVEEGKVKSYSSAKELMSELKKKADVQNKNNQQV